MSTVNVHMSTCPPVHGHSHGHMDIWTCGHVDIWSYGHVDIWSYGHVDIWIQGHVDIWTCGHMDIIDVWGYSDIRTIVVVIVG